MTIFQSGSVNTVNHWMVGTEWQYSKGVVVMHNDGFSCSCKKSPRKQCTHIQNVKLRILGVFQ